MLALLVLTPAMATAQSDSTSSWHQMGSDYVPTAITTTVEFDPETGDYVQIRKVGNVVLGRKYMTFEEYQDWQMDNLMRDYWRTANKTEGDKESSEGFLSKIPGFREISRKLESLLGRPEIKITPSGSAELTFQVVNNYRKDPQLDANKRSTTTFDFDENIQISLNAKIGDLINFDINWNTQATFDFENKIKLKYEGKEDDIIQLFEAADISFPLNTTLIKGSQQLFGFHTKLKFGKLTIDAVVSEKETSTENMQVKGGASSREFEIRADEYEENRHYFLSQYFYEQYNKSLQTLPVVNSPVKILRVEVWRTNIGAAVTQNRNLLALTDLGESNTNAPGVVGRGQWNDPLRPQSQLPRNSVNNMMQLINLPAIRSVNNVSSYMQGLGFAASSDYEKIESARLLNSSEYTLNEDLGFISLSQPLSSDQVLAVAFQYQVIGDTTVYQVGELTTDGVNDPNTLVVKLLKGTAIDTKDPKWRLMMKNVYFLKSTQISRDNFRLNVVYEGTNGGVGTGFFVDGPKEGVPLIELLGLDRMDATRQYYYADGVMDWFDSAAFHGGIIQSTTGRIFFPLVEPFGKDMRELLGDGEYADKYCFDSLYTMTRTLAQQYADKNKFYLEGYFTSKVSGEIALGYSVAPGSVTVTAGGVPLIENVDYSVDYTMGTVRIVNESILSSGTPISVSSENNSFSMMTKRMLGLHLNYEFEPNLNLGATVMNLYEKPLTQKNNFGEEPTSNTIWGIDFNWKTEVPWVTKIIDFLPGISTKAPSNLTLTAEFAHFIPGMTNTGSEDGKVSYVDDFEGAESSIDLKGINYWHLASTPQDAGSENPMFRETEPGSDLAYGFNRARLAWYRIDNIFYSSGSPRNIDADDRSQPYARRITEQEVFPNKELAAGEPTTVYEFNMAYYPEEKGPYNYETDATQYSAGMNAEGKLLEPKSRWGGIMRELDYTDFETQNIQTIEFWLMDPFIEKPDHTGGKLYINLGDISEDILRDGRKSFENGLPTSSVVTGVDTTIWGRVPTAQPVVNAFNNEGSSRKYQDVGYDGLSSTHNINDEQSFFASYVNRVGELFGTASQAYLNASSDPSSDDFHYYRSSVYDDNDVKINDRYKYYNNPEGNSSVDADSPESYSTAASSLPNVEDINKDNTLSEAENYYEYVVEIDPAHMNIGENYIVDIQEARDVELPNGTTTNCKWYQFRIPIREPERKVGKINGFQSIRFMRMFMKEFEEPIILRFATLELVYGTWRKYTEDLLQPGDYPTGYGENTSLNLGTVNIEENGSREPVPYVLPPGIEREEWYSTSSSYTQLNEQAVSIDITDLASGDARAIYRNTSYDLRYYGKLKMYSHAEKKFATDVMDDGDLVLFVRLGSDYTKNYYEYEMPLKFTDWGTSADDPYAIWPTENNIEIDLQAMTEIKTNRNRSIRSGEELYNSTMLYSEYIDGKKYSVLGRPNLGKVKVIMIGVRNPKGASEAEMVSRSAIVWINELRLSDYTNKGGWSAMALARTNLADVGNLSLYGSYTSAGFGNLEDKLTDPELINHLNLQATFDFEIGRMLPEKWGMHIPLYVDWANEIGSPEYNPLDQDVFLKKDIQTYQSKAERDSIKEMTQIRKQTTNLTLTNMRKERVGKAALKPHFYDFENFSFSYAYSGERSSDDDIEHYKKNQHRGGFSYNYSIQQPKQFRPFAKTKAFNNKNLKLFKEFNLIYQPKNLSFSTEIYRDFEETVLRNKSEALIIMKPTYFKQFTWRRDYGFQYDISTNLKVQYDANANARIDEPIGRIETRSASDSIWRSVLHGGTMQNYQHSLQVSYDVPIGKLPYLDFLRLPLTYRTSYNYQGGTEALKTMGNVIENSATFTANASANMQTLYNKFKLIKKAQAPPQPKKKDNKNSKDKDKDKNKLDKKRGMDQNDSISKAVADSIHKAEVAERWRQVGYFGLRFITGLRTLNVQYSQSGGGHIPGFMGEATIVGIDPRNFGAPGLFVLGQTDNVAEELLKNDLLSRDSLLNQPHWITGNRIFSLQASLEPIRHMKIDITATENYARREEYYYKYNSVEDVVKGPLSPMFSGSYTTTAWAIGTAFRNPDKLYNEFLENRHIVAERLAAANPDPYSSTMIRDSITGENFPAGYSANQQTVLLTSFLATYMGKDVSKHGFSPFLKMPLPNWSITYSGLGKIEALKKWFSNISLSHKYMSTYTIGGFYTDAAISGLAGYEYGNETVLNAMGDYVSPLSMEGIQITEQFNPLIKVALNMVNSLQLNFSLQRNRTLALSFANNQLTETSRNGITVGAGYRFKDVELHIKMGRLRKDIKNDIVLQFNLTYNSNKTEIRKINQNVSQISSGSKVWMAEISAEYALSTTLTLRLFFQTNINTPYISNAYPNSTTKGGLTIRFSF